MSRYIILKVVITVIGLASQLANCQDTSGLKFVRYDTLQLSFKATKVVAYKKGDVIFLFDYRKAKNNLTYEAKYGLLKELAKQQLDNIEKQFNQKDTISMDDAVFAKWNWAPFDQVLCDLINSRSCLIKDQQGNIYNRIIRMHGYVWPEKYIQWTGWRYFLPGAFTYFYECTESES